MKESSNSVTCVSLCDLSALNYSSRHAEIRAESCTNSKFIWGKITARVCRRPKRKGTFGHSGGHKSPFI